MNDMVEIRRTFGSLLLHACGVLSLLAAACCGPPAAELREAYAGDETGARFDHSILDGLLAGHVRPGGYVDYAGLSAEQDELERYLEAVADADFGELSRDEKLAFLINAYNAFTLKLILDHLPVESIQDIPAGERWEAKRWNLAGDVVSLDEIEHQRIRPKFAEPRIHFALVCAAVGCPPLRSEAYVGSRIGEQLQEQSEYVHSHDRWYRFSATAGSLHLTRLYDWYGDDFVQAAGSVLEFVARYSADVQAALDAGYPPRRGWLEYDWRLNSVDRSR